MFGLAGLSFCILVAAGTFDRDFWSTPHVSRSAFCQQGASGIGVSAQSPSKRRGPRPLRGIGLGEGGRLMTGPEAEAQNDAVYEGRGPEGRLWTGRGLKMGPKKYGGTTKELFRRRELAGLPRVPDHLKPQWEQIVDEHDERMSKDMTNVQLLAADHLEKKALAEQSEKKALEQPDDSVDRKRLRDIDEAFPQALPEKWEPPGFRKEKPREQKWTLKWNHEVTHLDHPRVYGEPKIQKNIRWLQNKKKAVAAVNGVFGTDSLANARAMKGKMMLQHARRLQSLQTNKPLTTSTLDNL